MSITKIAIIINLRFSILTLSLLALSWSLVAERAQNTPATH
jgi:hypothetical protein